MKREHGSETSYSLLESLNAINAHEIKASMLGRIALDRNIDIREETHSVGKAMVRRTTLTCEMICH